MKNYQNPMMVVLELNDEDILTESVLEDIMDDPFEPLGVSSKASRL